MGANPSGDNMLAVNEIKSQMDLIDELDAFGVLLEEFCRLVEKNQNSYLNQLIIDHYKKIQEQLNKLVS